MQELWLKVKKDLKQYKKTIIELKAGEMQSFLHPGEHFRRTLF